jgi:hypothetical protein
MNDQEIMDLANKIANRFALLVRDELRTNIKQIARDQRAEDLRILMLLPKRREQTEKGYIDWLIKLNDIQYALREEDK